MKSIKVSFQNKDGHVLSGLLELPIDGRPHAFALFAHCFTCTKNFTAIRNISRALSLNGIAVFRFDFTGLGESEGEFGDTTFSSNIADLLSAAEHLETHYQAPALAIGHSLGGTAVLMAASSLPSVKAVVTIGSPCDPDHVKHLLKGDLTQIEKEGKAEVSIGGRTFTVQKQFLDDLSRFEPATDIHALRRALLVLHSPQDRTVSIDNAAAIYQAARHPKSFISLDGADHLMTKPEDSLYGGEMIASWVKRYIDIPQAEPLTSHKRVAVRIGPDSLTTEVKAGNHSLLADEPKAIPGGHDLGPTPYDLVTAGLGACTAMTLRMYADRKQWPLKNVIVHLQHDKIHAQDSEHTEKKPMLDQISREIEVEGDLTDEQRNRLLEIAEKCPVHRTLHSSVQIVSTLLELEDSDAE
ncbi:bifunctional alpha/beta hydrolase/OsmC family protein [Nibrella saemangeumensis]|uniref:Bifunctional alpha/beta hydrolase/OsmC family protein n=1 Tax=Nibrella saemangeumensis TaxID=1084526 RepID=A0ABP8NMM3_9BACT